MVWRMLKSTCGLSYSKAYLAPKSISNRLFLVERYLCLAKRKVRMFLGTDMGLKLFTAYTTRAVKTPEIHSSVFHAIFYKSVIKPIQKSPTQISSLCNPSSKNVGKMTKASAIIYLVQVYYAYTLIKTQTF